MEIDLVDLDGRLHVRIDGETATDIVRMATWCERARLYGHRAALRCVETPDRPAAARLLIPLADVPREDARTMEIGSE